MPEEKRDYYEVLEVFRKGASSDEDKKAYRKTAKESIIPILILMTKLQKKNSKECSRSL